MSSKRRCDEIGAAFQSFDDSGYVLMHISDSHIGDKPNALSVKDVFARFFNLEEAERLAIMGSHSPDILGAAAEFALQFKNELDALVFTGDLATTGASADIVQAREYVDPSGALGNPRVTRRPSCFRQDLPRIGDVGIPLAFLPGNHDRYVDVSPVDLLGGRKPFAPGGDVFGDVFRHPLPCGSSWPKAQRVGNRKILERDGKRPLVIVSADFSLLGSDNGSGTFGFLGQGRVDQATCNDLVQFTQRTRDEFADAGVIWAVHFPPDFPGLETDLSLLDSELLVAAASAARVQHIFCGHTHTDGDYSLAGGSLQVHCAGSVGQSNASENSFLIHAVSVYDSDNIGVRSIKLLYDRVVENSFVLASALDARTD